MLVVDVEFSNLNRERELKVLHALPFGIEEGASAPVQRLYISASAATMSDDVKERIREFLGGKTLVVFDGDEFAVILSQIGVEVERYIDLSVEGRHSANGCQQKQGYEPYRYWQLSDWALHLGIETAVPIEVKRLAFELKSPESLHDRGMTRTPSSRNFTPRLEVMITMAQRLKLNWDSAARRGEYLLASAVVESRGLPVHSHLAKFVSEHGCYIQSKACHGSALPRALSQYGGSASAAWRDYIAENKLDWPKKNGRLDLSLRSFERMAEMDEFVLKAYKVFKLRTALATILIDANSNGIAVSALRPLMTVTGRSAPSSRSYIPNLPRALRFLLRSELMQPLVHVDYSQQEVGIAAALSKDPLMLKAYKSRDTYLAAGKQLGVLPNDATRESHPKEREQMKQVCLGLLYGMTAHGIAKRLKVSLYEAKQFVTLHQETYHVFWRWLEAFEIESRARGYMALPGVDWSLQITGQTKSTTLRNWPMQAMGAAILRVAVLMFAKTDLKIMAPHHDSVYLQCERHQAAEQRKLTVDVLKAASARCLDGFSLNVTSTTVLQPEHWCELDKRLAEDDSPELHQQVMDAVSAEINHYMERA